MSPLLPAGVVWYYSFDGTTIGTEVKGNFMTPDSSGNLVGVNDIYTGLLLICGLFDRRHAYYAYVYVSAMCKN